MAKDKQTFREQIERRRREAAGVTFGGREQPANNAAVNRWARNELRKTYRLPPDREEDRDDREEQ